MNPTPLRFRRGLLALLMGLSLSASSPPSHAFWPEAREAPLTRLAFGSCNKADQPQPVWASVARLRPDLWIWAGDIVYKDLAPPALLRAEFERQYTHPDYAPFRATTPIVGTWDDHDYGVPDGGRDNPHAREAQAILLDFLDEPAGSPRRSRAGVYERYTWGPPAQQVDVFVLDLRMHRAPPARAGALLGEAQWAWLEAGLRESRAALKIIVSSTQFALNVPFGETWAGYPQERRRLLHLIDAAGIGGVLILSGDKHLGDVARVGRRRVGYPLVDFTSSGLTHSIRDHHPLVPFLAPLVFGPGLYRAPNFGTVSIDWTQTPVQIHLRLHDVEGTVVRSRTLALDALSPRR